MNCSNHTKSLIFESPEAQILRVDIHRAIDLRIDQFLQKCRISEISSDNSKITWLKNEDALSLFFNLLRKYKYIDCAWEFFLIHFSGNETSLNKIVFLKPTNQLPYIMHCLQGDGFIAACNQPHIRLAQHFFDRFHKPISSNVLRASLNKGLGNKIKEFIEKNIIDKLKDLG